MLRTADPVSPVIEQIRAQHGNYDALSSYDKTRLLRQYAYARIVLASCAGYHLAKDVLARPLADVFGVFDRNEGGVWCGGAATLLTRLYLEAGFRAWKYTYGIASLATHAVTLVDVDGHMYVQDAYFNTDYVADDGQPLPFLDVLEGLRFRRPPRLRQDTAIRKGLFVSEANVRGWITPGLQDTVVCEPLSAGRVLCRFPMTFEGYVSNLGRASEVADWLTAAGYSNDWSYLMLHPRRGQKFFSVRPGMFHGPLEPDYEMALSISRIINLPLPETSAPCERLNTRSSGPSNASDALVHARVQYLGNRVDELQEDIVRLIDQNRGLLKDNEHLQKKLAQTRATFRNKLAKARARSG